MLNNYFLLVRLSRELRSELLSSRLLDSFSQEKNKLILVFSVNEQEKVVEFHSGSNLPYLQMRNTFRRAKKNTTTFFEELHNQNIVDIRIARFERIIKFIFGSADLFFIFRGRESNVALISKDGSPYFFKNADERQSQSLIAELGTIEYGHDFSNLIPPEKNISHQNLKSQFPSLGKKIIDELKTRYCAEEDQSRENIVTVLEEIQKSSLGIYFDKIRKTFHLLPVTFNSAASFELKERFTSVNEAVHTFLLEQLHYAQFYSTQNKIEKHLSREILYVQKRIEIIEKRLGEGSKEDAYTQFANLLLINLNDLSHGMKEAEVANVFSDESRIKITLKENLSPNENVTCYFSKAKSERFFFKRAGSELFELKNRLADLKQNETIFNTLTTFTQIKDFMKTLHMKNESEANETNRAPFKLFLIDGTYKVYVGKDSKNNDLLTTRFAKQNDFWFHARSVSGSHVVLRVENSKAVVPKPVLKKAAQLAAFYSKAKTASLAPVSYTLKKFVVKRKGMDPGQVALLKEESLLVKPEIPEGCEQVNEDNF